MDFGKAYTYITEDEDWIVKIVIAAAILLFSGFLLFIPAIALYGYQVAIMRNDRIRMVSMPTEKD